MTEEIAFDEPSRRPVALSEIVDHVRDLALEGVTQDAELIKSLLGVVKEFSESDWPSLTGGTDRLVREIVRVTREHISATGKTDK